MNRRDFLRTSAAGLALSTLSPLVYAQGAEEKLRVGLIGSGWYGKCDLFRLIQVAPVEVVSVSDVDSRMVAEAAEMISQRKNSGKKPRTYGDYREQLKEQDLDLCIIGTPDHWHALPMIAAVEAGADVYVQKPISVDISEGKAMLDAARKTGKTVQVGTQRRSTPHLMSAIEKVIRPGLLGNIGHVEICCYYHMRANTNPPIISPPDYLDYEMWAGPAPKRPYNELIHPRRWRAFMEYGNGIVGDMCIHMYDMVRWMLDLGWPTSVSSSGGIYVQKDSIANITDTQTATFEHPDFDIVWNHRSYGNAPDPEYPWAAFIYGDKGTLKASVNKWDFIPFGGGKPMHEDVVLELDEYPEDRTEKDLEKHVAPAIRGHMNDWLQARREGTKPVADIEQGYMSTTACILANMSMELGRTLHWDPENHRVKNDDEANQHLARDYRGPWVHPGA